MRNKRTKFDAKLGDTKRALTVCFLQDGEALDEQPESVAIKIVGASGTVTAAMTYDASEEKWFWRPGAEDLTTLGAGTANWNATLTWADATQATCPTIGNYTLQISAPL